MGGWGNFSYCLFYVVGKIRYVNMAIVVLNNGSNFVHDAVRKWQSPTEVAVFFYSHL